MKPLPNVEDPYHCESSLSSLRATLALMLATTLIGGASCSSAPTGKGIRKHPETQATPPEDPEVAREALAREVNDEVTVGRGISAKLLGHFGLYKNDPEALEYVNLLGQTLALQSGRPELKFTFSILNSDQINAFAAPGGFIFVTKGLLRTVRNESELAVALGHEIAHINEKHMYKDIMPKREVSATETFARILSRGRGDLGASITKIVGAGMKMLVEEGLGAEKEASADEAGVQYALAAGYNPHDLVQLLTRMESEMTGVKLTKTHPPFPARISGLSQFLAKNGFENRLQGDSSVMASRFDKALAKLRKTPPAPTVKN